jgi:cytochrome c553
VAMQKVTRRSFVTSVGAASVLPASADAAPCLAGQSSEYISSALKAFHAGSRKNDAGKLMRSVAGHLADADIAAASAYFANEGSAARP